LSKFHIVEVKDDVTWDAFVEASPQGTVFALSRYLELAVDYYRRYWIYKGSQVKGGMSLMLNANCTACVMDDLVIHNGLMFVEDSAVKQVKARLERFEITEFAIKWLLSEFTSVELALAPQFEDIRPFLWHNYHSLNPDDKFAVDHRYTSYLDISSLCGGVEEQESVLFKGLETLRQRNIREARKDGAAFELNPNSTLLVDGYRTLMIDQKAPVDDGKLSRMARLIDGLIQEKMAVLCVTSNGLGEAIYTTVFCWDTKRAYYLFGAPSSETSERYQGTIALWDSFLWLVKQGIDEVDLEGINSPQRGRFKLGFGGGLRPYLQISK